jgi:hypothetical protein
MFVPFVERARDWSNNRNFYAPSSFWSSQIAYDIALPSGSSCANVTQTQSASLVKTYIQGWIPYIDLGCPGVATFPAQAFTVPVSNPPSGTFIFNCDGACPAPFFGMNDTHGVGTLSMSIPIDAFQPGSVLYIDSTFIPDDPNQLPMRLSYPIDVPDSSSCPTDITIQTNGPPPTP